MKQFIGKYYDGYNRYLLINAEDKEDAETKLYAYLEHNKIEYIELSLTLHNIDAVIK